MVALDSRVPAYSLLITDDDETCRSALQDVLQPDGYDTLLAGSGREAIQVVRSHRIHVILIDMYMPDLTGLETLRLIREEVASPLPFILMSAERSSELQSKALSADAFSVLWKPINVGIVRQVVDDVIRKYYAA